MSRLKKYQPLQNVTPAMSDKTLIPLLAAYKVTENPEYTTKIENCIQRYQAAKGYSDDDMRAVIQHINHHIDETWDTPAQDANLYREPALNRYINNADKEITNLQSKRTVNTPPPMTPGM